MNKKHVVCTYRPTGEDVEVFGHYGFGLVKIRAADGRTWGTKRSNLLRPRRKRKG